MDEVEGRVIHLVKFVHLQHPLYLPGEIVHNVAVLAVKGRFPLGDQIQVEVPFVIVGQLVDQTGVHAVGDLLRHQGLIQHFAAQLRALPHRREYQHPRIELVGGEVEKRLGVQNHRSLVLRGLILFIVLLLVLLFIVLFLVVLLFLLFLLFGPLGGLQPCAARCNQRCPQPVQLPAHHLRRQYALLVQTDAGRRQIAGLVPPLGVETENGVILGQLQKGHAERAGAGKLRRDLVNGFRLSAGRFRLFGLLTEQKVREFVLD